jgi:hypothetical protein
MWDKIVNFLKGNSVPRHVIVHCLLVVGFLIPVWILGHSLQRRAEKFISEWRADLQPITCAGDKKLDLPAATQASEEERKRLAGQFQEIRGRMNFHFDVLATFYKNYFSTIILAGVLASFAAIALLFITSDGWQHSSPYARTIFLVATASATYCAAFPSIFQQQQNIDDNKGLYLEYVALTNEMCSYASTGETPDNNQPTAKTFIHSVDTRLKDLNKIAIGFDITKAPDFYEAFRKGFGTSPGATPPDSGTTKKKRVPAAKSKN